MLRFLPASPVPRLRPIPPQPPPTTTCQTTSVTATSGERIRWRGTVAGARTMGAGHQLLVSAVPALQLSRAMDLTDWKTSATLVSWTLLSSAYLTRVCYWSMWAVTATCRTSTPAFPAWKEHSLKVYYNICYAYMGGYCVLNVFATLPNFAIFPIYGVFNV